MGGNLPPGVTDSMIPGNRPEDIAYEKLVDDIYGALGGTEDKPLGDGDAITITDEVIDRLVAFAGKQWDAGYQAGLADEAMARRYAEENARELQGEPVHRGIKQFATYEDAVDAIRADPGIQSVFILRLKRGESVRDYNTGGRIYGPGKIVTTINADGGIIQRISEDKPNG